jgi:hypothetical protein
MIFLYFWSVLLARWTALRDSTVDPYTLPAAKTTAPLFVPFLCSHSSMRASNCLASSCVALAMPLVRPPLFRGRVPGAPTGWRSLASVANIRAVASAARSGATVGALGKRSLYPPTDIL